VLGEAGSSNLYVAPYSGQRIDPKAHRFNAVKDPDSDQSLRSKSDVLEITGVAN